MKRLRVIVAALAGLLLIAPASFAQDTDVESLIRQASKECRTAKTLRRSNLEQAQSHFLNYRRLLQEALQRRPDLLDSPDAGTERVLNFCDTVKRDLDRAEALPQFEKGLRECAEARVMIANAAFDDAEEKYQRYREYKEGALAISESVLEVYENSYEVRLCDQLGDDIAQAREEYQQQLREAALEARNLFQDVVDGLRQARRQCRGAQNLVNDVDGYGPRTVDRIKTLSEDAKATRSTALAERDRLLAEGNTADAGTSETINSLLTEIDDCQSSVSGGVNRVQAALASRSKESGSKQSKENAGPADREFRQIVGAPAEYPRRAIRRGVEGEVLVRFTITAEGDVSDISIIKADPEGWFEDSVREAVAKYKFQPRIRGGKPVPTENVERKVVFQLQ